MNVTQIEKKKGGGKGRKTKKDRQREGSQRFINIQ